MSSADIARILEASAHSTTVSGCLWKVAVDRLLISDASHSVLFLTTQVDIFLNCNKTLKEPFRTLQEFMSLAGFRLFFEPSPR